MPQLIAKWEDPDFEKKASAFFLSDYKHLRNILLHPKTASNSKGLIPRNSDTKYGYSFNLGVINLPKKILPKDSFIYMVKARDEICRMTSAVPCPTADAAEAGIFLLRRVILCIANRFATKALMLMAIDDRYHTRRNLLQFDVADLFAVDARKEESFLALREMPICMAAALRLAPGETIGTAFGDAIETLHMLSRIFFNMLQAAFALPEVTACSMAFDSVLLNLKNTVTIESSVNAFRDRYREMHAAIVSYYKNGHQTDVQRLMAEQIKANIIIQGKLDQITACTQKTQNGVTKKRHYRCSHKIAAKLWEVSESTIENWRAFNRVPRPAHAREPPAEFPTGYDVSKEEMKHAAQRYHGHLV